MPNWVKTIVKTEPKVLKDVLKKYSHKGEFSFDKVIPMPKDLDIESGNRGEFGLAFLFLENSHNISKELIDKTFIEQEGMAPHIYYSSTFERAVELYNTKKGTSEYKECIALAKKYISNYEKYGYTTWYQWRVENWGTKWEVSDFENNNDTMIFRTAWNFPDKIMLELSKKYPSAVFLCKFADEGIPENSGILSIKNGKFTKVHTHLNNREINNIWNTYLGDNTYAKDLEEEIEK